ncbi:MAG TPA: type IV secretory system conjugative DNA transfer family protein [Frateuria sp.]|uniref:type IV secretory system conjugative DNA transfer family protein n=1 Tax=Frateuria sp. TaxID=2211372 RepID=UPI002DF54E5E|nr:type IV secretory system conjugative DNA transfer family protein [Frateuria sp.]
MPGADAAQTYVTNHAASIVFSPREQQDADNCSKMLGDTTVRRRNRTVSKGTTSYTYAEERRPLMLPQELRLCPSTGRSSSTRVARRSAVGRTGTSRARSSGKG